MSMTENAARWVVGDETDGSYASRDSIPINSCGVNSGFFDDRLSAAGPRTSHATSSS